MSAAALIPDPRAPLGPRMGMGGTERRRLKKVQLVERDWELWRAEDWVGYGRVDERVSGMAIGAQPGKVD